jgi:hypothetical protein
MTTPTMQEYSRAAIDFHDGVLAATDALALTRQPEPGLPSPAPSRRSSP